MLVVYDKNRVKLGVLENAYNIVEDLQINSLNYLNFMLPATDEKVKLIKPFGYIEIDDRLYRVLPKTIEDDALNTVKFECEHCIATLLDDVIVGNVIMGNLGVYTREVLEYLLSKQVTKRWILGDCDFNRQFEYAWENESLLSALWSIPRPLEDDYIWEFDTTGTPWVLHLRQIKIDAPPTLHIVPKKNQLRLRQISDPKNLFTRIIPLGYGEGVNQLDIREVNNGIMYLESPPHIIEKYGLIQRIWIDRRYENAESLRDAAQSMLNGFQEPINEYDVDFTVFKEEELEKITLGTKVRLENQSGEYIDDFIVGIKFNYDDIPASKITLANQTKSVSGTIADLADRQRIEMSYSQGATTVYSHSFQDNADTRYGASLDFPIPAELRIVNKVIAKIRVQRFRAYSQATAGGGAYSETTEGGGGSSPTTELGGMSYPTTNYAGEQQRTTSQYQMGGQSTQSLNDSYHWGQHNHAVTTGVVYLLTTGGGSVQFQPSGAHHHGLHDHEVRISGHAHEVNIREHKHVVHFDPHKHRFSLPDHTHAIVAGIYQFGNAKSVTVKVNGKVKSIINESSFELDLTEMLLNDKNKISRGTWHNLEIVPDDLAYISISLMVQGFVQSRGDYTV